MGARFRGDFMAGYFRYWGKAERDGERYHLLPYHCLDVAAVTGYWCLPVPRTSGDEPMGE